MENVATQLKLIKSKYDRGGSPFLEIKEMTRYCFEKLGGYTTRLDYGSVREKSYYAFSDEKEISRPINASLYMDDLALFESCWEELVRAVSTNNFQHIDPHFINATLYTAIMSFSSCFDIWKKTSRKTPGTYYEIMLGSFLSEFLPRHSRGKHISLPNLGEQVTTDIVLDDGETGFAIPVKITTRERIGQPYAHQRILDSCFGVGRYKSILLCVSETQRDDRNSQVNEICVPGTLNLYQAHLSVISGLYYLDPPRRYLAEDVTCLLPVGDYAQLFICDLPALLSNQERLPR